MESERKIEKLLRAFAKKRREQAGDALPLHAVNRRLLQDEVRRRVPKPEPRKSWWEQLVGLRPGLISGLCLIALVAVFAALLLPALSRAKNKGQLASKRAEETQLRDLSSQPAAASPVSSADPASGPAPPPDEFKVDHLKSNGEIRTASPGRENLPEPPKAELSLFFKSNRQAGDAEVTADTGRTRELPKSLALSPAPTVATPALESDRAGLAGRVISATNGMVLSRRQSIDGFGAQSLKGDSTVAVGQRFAQVPHPLMKASSNSLPVLASFELIQNGGELRIVDGDGSIYDGALRQEGRILADSAVGGKVQSMSSLGVESADKQVQSVQPLFFRVSGTNRTLNRNIVFAGELSFLTNQSSVASMDANVSVDPGGKAKAIHLIPLSTLRGALIIDGKEIPIWAEPTASTNR
jgi:hypothetical protein